MKKEKNVRRHWNNERGFTLVELMVVVTIIAILAAIGLPRLTNYIRTAETAEPSEVIGRVNRAVSGFVDSRTHTATLVDIVTWINAAPTLSAGHAAHNLLPGIIPHMKLGSEAEWKYDLIAIQNAAADGVDLCVVGWKPTAVADTTGPFVLFSSTDVNDPAWEGLFCRVPYVENTAASVPADYVPVGDGGPCDGVAFGVFTANN